MRSSFRRSLTGGESQPADLRAHGRARAWSRASPAAPGFFLSSTSPSSCFSRHPASSWTPHPNTRPAQRRRERESHFSQMPPDAAHSRVQLDHRARPNPPPTRCIRRHFSRPSPRTAAAQSESIEWRAEHRRVPMAVSSRSPADRQPVVLAGSSRTKLRRSSTAPVARRRPRPVGCLPAYRQPSPHPVRRLASISTIPSLPPGPPSPPRRTLRLSSSASERHLTRQR